MTERRDEDGGDWQVAAEEQLCRSTFDEGSLQLEEPALVYDPQIRRRPGQRAEIWGRRENASLIAWGFWGGVVAVVAVVAFVLVYSSPARVEPLTVLGLLSAIIGGAVLYRLGRRSNLEDRLLCEIDGEHRILSWPTSAEGTLVAVAFEDVESVTFERIRFAIPDSRAGTKLDAVALRIVDDRGRRLPIIEASTSKAEAHRVSRFLAEILDLEVEYVGTGVGEWV